MDAFDWATLILFLHVTFWVGFSGVRATMKATTSQWYKNLKKAPWQPPAAAFQIWTVLYVLIALAGWFALRKNSPGKWYYHASMAFWMAQLITNGLWTPVFFGLREPLLALILIILTLIFAVVTMAIYFLFVSVSAYMFIPYVAWLAFATSLNGYIVFNNDYSGSDIKKTTNM